MPSCFCQRNAKFVAWGCELQPPSAVSSQAQDLLRRQVMPNSFSQQTDSCSVAALRRILPKLVTLVSDLYSGTECREFLQYHFGVLLNQQGRTPGMFSYTNIFQYLYSPSTY